MPVMLYLRGFSAKDLAHVLDFIYKVAHQDGKNLLLTELRQL